MSRTGLSAGSCIGGLCLKRRVLIGALSWAVFISAIHIQLNVGWRELVGAFQPDKRELMVGFLPVT